MTTMQVFGGTVSNPTTIANMQYSLPYTVVVNVDPNFDNANNAQFRFLRKAAGSSNLDPMTSDNRLFYYSSRSGNSFYYSFVLDRNTFDEIDNLQNGDDIVIQSVVNYDTSHTYSVSCLYYRPSQTSIINTSQFALGSTFQVEIVDNRLRRLWFRNEISQHANNQVITLPLFPNQAYLIVTQGDISTQYYLPPVSNVCFIKDTPVQTEQGIFPIQQLTNKHTILGQSIQLTKTVSPEKQLVQIQKGALGRNIPSQTTTLSLQHKLSINKQMICAKDLVNHKSIRLIPYEGQTLYNVLLNEHAVMNVNGLVAETLDPKCLVAELYKGKYVPKNKRIVLPVENKVYSIKEYEPLRFRLHK